MLIAAINLSQRLPDDTLKRIVDAHNLFLVDVAQHWGWQPLHEEFYKPDQPLGDAVFPCYYREHAGVEGALGDHDVADDGRPRAEVDVGAILDDGGTLTDGPDSVSACGAHEAAELDGDEFASYWSDMPADADGNDQVALELADPVEMDFYLKDGIAVSNFVLPEWFNARAKKGARFDMMGKLTAPFTMTQAGYLITRGPKGFSQVYADGKAELWKPWRVAKKARPHSRTMRRMRVIAPPAPSPPSVL